MSKHYDCPVEIRELEKALGDFTYRNGFQIVQVFSDFLGYIISGYTLPGYPGLTNWRYTKKQTKEFWEMYTMWVKIMERQIRIKGWYDAFGDLFMSLISRSSAQYKGQFFTPSEICDVMAMLTYGNNPKEKPRLRNFNDPTSGSGRLLLAANTHYPGNFMVGQDVDNICCQMTVCNFLINSCVGIVICMNTLTLKDFRGAWLVNEFYYRTNLPSIRPLSEQELNAIQNSEKWRALLVSPEKYDDFIKMGDMWDVINQLLK